MDSTYIKVKQRLINVKLNDDQITKHILNNKKFLKACFSCNGRDYTTANIKAAVQTLNKKPLEYKKLEG